MRGKPSMNEPTNPESEVPSQTSESPCPTLATATEEPAPAPAPEVPTRSLHDVMKALMRFDSRALIFEHLAAQVVSDFTDDGGKKPRLRLQLPNGTVCRAEVDDVLDVQAALLALAASERKKVWAVRAARVPIDPALVDHDDTPGSYTPPPAGEYVIATPESRSPSSEWTTTEAKKK
jgi:hypothetical protein